MFNCGSYHVNASDQDTKSKTVHLASTAEGATPYAQLLSPTILTAEDEITGSAAAVYPGVQIAPREWRASRRCALLHSLLVRSSGRVYMSCAVNR